MQERVNILSAEQYFKKFGVDGIGKGADRWMIKRQLVDAFRKEIFGLITLRLKKTVDNVDDIPDGDPEAERIARNVIHDTTMKWKKLCGMFAKYKETANLLQPNDLKLYDEMEENGNGPDGDADGDSTADAGSAEDQPAEVEADGHDGSAVDGSDEGDREADGRVEGDTGGIEVSQPDAGADDTEITDTREKHVQE